ncbi:hypothetical protein KP509_01G007200 [Ceratopteris richardii]|uniref:Flagellar associated protein n=1 Tax=Ceratopteris richardii TaxID=49495 RepID=A0A8T2VDH8_CERRI|nr:hypothetical protein KP509_01G007200 [Ceratopteris richardii]
MSSVTKRGSREARSAGTLGGTLSPPDLSVYDGYSASTVGFTDYNSSMGATRNSPSIASSERRRPFLSLRLPRSPKAKQLRSSFGRQPLSHRATEPAVRFGSSDRVKLGKLYYNAELSKCRIGIDGPGPVYDVKSTLGKQFISKNESSPTIRFGSANRFTRHRYGEGTPGPGTYNSSSSFGPQVLSYQQSPWFADFSRSTRDQQNKIYLSTEFDKNKYGTQSPGPCVCDLRSSLGPQTTAPNRTAPQISFGGEKRFRYGSWSQRNASPGAGQYKSIGSVGKQPESKKKNCPSFTFSHSDREHRAKVFISMEHDKAHYGEESPGPGSTKKITTSLGQQIDSRKASCMMPRFGTAPRFRTYYDANPGPGEYEC